jgi:hypothetical protein
MRACMLVRSASTTFHTRGVDGISSVLLKIRFQILAGCSATLRVFMENNPKKNSKKIYKKNLQKKITKKNLQKKFTIFFPKIKKNMPKLLRMLEGPPAKNWGV